MSTVKDDHYNPTVRLLQIPKTSKDSCGFHLTRSKCDPYPWVTAVEAKTPAEITGLKAGDCILEVNGEDVLGLRICEIATLVKGKSDIVNLLVWNSGFDTTCDPESICCGPMPLNLERLSVCMQTIMSCIECPVCLDTIQPPAMQCLNGHLLCLKCRMRSEKSYCPICRQRYQTGRCLISEQIYNCITNTFNLRTKQNGCKEENGNGKFRLREKLFGVKFKGQPHNELQGMLSSTPTNKFLAKLLGKASSMENLSTTNDINKSANNRSYLNANAKILSLSANNLPPVLKDDSTIVIAIPRCPSKNRLRPLNGKLSVSTTSILQRRDFLQTETDMSLKIPIPIKTVAQQDVCKEHLYNCPCSCNKKFTGPALESHIKVEHNLTIVSTNASSIEISLPLKSPISNAAVFILNLEGKNFWIKVGVDEDGSIHTSALVQDSEVKRNDYMMETRLRNQAEDKIYERELIMRSIVNSLCTGTWTQNCILFNSSAIKTTFPLPSIDSREFMLEIHLTYRSAT